MTRWSMKRGDPVCTQIAARTQLICMDPNLEANRLLATVYDVPFKHRNLGQWFNSLFNGEIKYHKVPLLDVDSRANLLKELPPTCALCRGMVVEPQIDHRIPRARGGSNDFKNLQVMHKGCNIDKSDKLMGRLANGRTFLTPFNLQSLRSELSKSVDSALRNWGVPGFRTVRVYNRLGTLSGRRLQQAVLDLPGPHGVSLAPVHTTGPGGGL